MVVKFPCKICLKAVANSHHAIQCDNCNIWVHIKCNKINTQTYKFLQKSSAAWYCIKCSEEIYPFSNISHEDLFETNQGKSIKFKVFTQKNSEQNIDLTDTLNKAMDDPNSKMMTAKYYKLDEISNLLSSTSPNRSFFHLNIPSLTFHYLCQGYNIEHTPTESSNGRTLLYTKQGINYKLRKDLQIYKSKELESTFIEVLEPGMPGNNMIIVCICCHPSMELSGFDKEKNGSTTRRFQC